MPRASCTATCGPATSSAGVGLAQAGRFRVRAVRHVAPHSHTSARPSGPPYMSPEQAVGERVDARSDLFSLGAVAYRLLTGRDAFEAEEPRRSSPAWCTTRPEPPSALVPGLPSGVDDVLARALAKSRKDRYADAKSLCDDVDDVRAGRPPRNARGDAKKEDAASFPSAADAEAPAGDTTGAGCAPVGSPARGPRHCRLRRARAGRRPRAAAAAARVLQRDSRRAPGRGSPPARRGDAASLERLGPPLHRRNAERPLVARLQAPVREGHARGVGRRRQGVGAPRQRHGQEIRLRHQDPRRARAPGHRPPPRPPQIVVRVLWGDDERTEGVAGTFTAGATRRLSAKVARIGKSLSVEWEP